MICCLTARKLGAQYTIARIRNPEYNATLEELKRDLGINMTINPEYATAIEMSRLLRFPSATNIETFCRGRVELMGFRLQPGDFMVGKPLRDLPGQVKKLSILFCAVDRNGEVFIPNGAFVPQADDKVYMIGRPTGLTQFFRLLGRHAPKVNRVLIVGGGKISTYLAALLLKMKMKVKIIEQDEERCRKLSEEYPELVVVCGDGSDQEVLESESLHSFDAFLALTGRDEENLIISLYAAQQGISKVVTKSNRQNYAGIARDVGLDSVVSPKIITAAHILKVVRGMENSQGSVMNALYRIADGAAEAMEFSVTKATRNLGIPLKELKLKSGILLAVVVRGNEIIIPEGTTSIKDGDSVILVSKSPIQNINDIYDESFVTGGGKA
jgi:trk system potassium uptake protein TrkA